MGISEWEEWIVIVSEGCESSRWLSEWVILWVSDFVSEWVILWVSE